MLKMLGVSFSSSRLGCKFNILEPMFRNASESFILLTTFKYLYFSEQGEVGHSISTQKTLEVCDVGIEGVTAYEVSGE